MKQTAISIIIPVYNAEAFLHECLNSICQQTFTNFEVWMINDGSKDSSGKICDSFVQKDSRFHVIHKSNSGVSSARNMGIEAANGEWIAFVDSDDTVDTEYLQTLYRSTSQADPETLFMQGFKTVKNNSVRETREFPHQRFHSQEISSCFHDLLIHRSGYPFGKLYNIHIIRKHHIRFNEQIHYAEDVMFMLTYICHITTIQTLSGAHYNYYIRNNNSLSQRIFSFESEYACYQTYLSLIDRIKKRFDMPDDKLLKPYQVISEYLVRRCIGSLYQPETRKKFAARMGILKSITPQQLRFLNSYYKQCSWFHKVTLILLTKHYYYLCDQFNMAISCRFAIKKTIKRYL